MGKQKKTKSALLERRFHKALADDLSYALFLLRKLGDEGPELLARHRRNNTYFIAAKGLTVTHPEMEPTHAEPQQPVKYEFVPPEVQRSLEIIDAAFEKLHRFRVEGGADEYLSAGVYRAVKRAESSRPRNDHYEEYAAYLAKRGYEASDDKRSIRDDAAQRFGTSERAIYRALKAWSEKEK
jgi:hypothetical protein